jgi:dUTP pyrophosphatase
MKPIVGVELFKPYARKPEYAYGSDSGADLFACEDTIIKAGERKLVSTGIKMQFPEGWAGTIKEKSGLALKKGVQIMGGVIDSSYRGEVNVLIHNLSDETITFDRGDKVAQIEIRRVYQAEFTVMEQVSDTARSANGFGSTGR